MFRWYILIFTDLEHKIMKKKEEILKSHLSGYWKEQIGHHPLMDNVLNAMEEYAQQQVKNLNIPAVGNNVCDIISIKHCYFSNKFGCDKCNAVR